MRPHRRQPTRLPRPWDSLGKNTGVGCHFLLQCMKVKSESEVAQSCPTLSDPMDCSLTGSSVHGIFQARVLQWDAIAFSDSTCDLSLSAFSWPSCAQILSTLHEFPKGTSQKSWCMPELKNHWFRLEKNGREKTKSVNSGWAPG